MAAAVWVRKQDKHLRGAARRATHNVTHRCNDGCPARAHGGYPAKRRSSGRGMRSQHFITSRDRSARNRPSDPRVAGFDHRGLTTIREPAADIHLSLLFCARVRRARAWSSAMTQRYVGSHPEREGLWDWDLLTNRIHFSPRWLSLIGCNEHEIGHRPDSWPDRIHPDDRDRVVRELASVRTEGRCELDVPHRLRHSNGTYRWMSCRALAERDHGGQPIRLSGWHADVTADEVIDRITGLPNHKLLLDRLALAIERAQGQPSFHFALLLVDPGHRPLSTACFSPLWRGGWKHLCGWRMTTPGLFPGHLVARLHGDQFAVLLEGLKDVAQTKVIADRLLSELLAPFSPGGDEVFLAPTIGVAVSATVYQSGEGMIRDAETALHRARTIGGGTCELFDTAILKSEEAQAGLDQALRDALEQGEFRLFYQPIMSLTSNRIIGFEALVRWQHPTRGVVSPLEFIPLAEKTGFIVPLGRWILREACGQLKRWQDTLGADCWISVNLSAAQFKHPALVEEIAEGLSEAGIDASRLTLELTESMAMENPVAVKTVLMRLRALGVHISIDDFGTGYSSLAHLRQFPVDTLKVAARSSAGSKRTPIPRRLSAR